MEAKSNIDTECLLELILQFYWLFTFKINTDKKRIKILNSH